MSRSDDGVEGAARFSRVGRIPALGGVKVRFQLLFFLYFIASSGFVVFRNVYLEEIGLSGTQMGQIGFVLMAAGVVAQPAWGLLTDYFRAERTVLAVAGVTSGLTLLSYPVGNALTATFLVVALGTVAFSILRAPIAPIATGMVLSRGFDYGSVRAYGSLAFALGSLGFGFVVGTLGSVSIIYVYVAGAALLAAIAWSLPAEKDDNADEDDGDGNVDEPSLLTATKTLVTNPVFLVVMGASFLLRLSAMGGEAFFSVYMRQLGVSLAVGPWSIQPDGMTGIAWMINSGIEAVAFLYALKANKSHKWLLVVGGVIVVIPNLVYGVTTQPWVLLAVQSLGGIGFAMSSVAAVEIVDGIAAERVTSTAQTLLTGVGYGLGGAAGQIVAGTLYDAIGIMDMYVGIAILGFVGAAVGLLVSADRRPDESRPAA
jgi:MFS transporter, PPP family, 3-phenylpropionic acid transporter